MANGGLFGGMASGLQSGIALQQRQQQLKNDQVQNFMKKVQGNLKQTDAQLKQLIDQGGIMKASGIKFEDYTAILEQKMNERNRLAQMLGTEPMAFDKQRIGAVAQQVWVTPEEAQRAKDAREIDMAGQKSAAQGAATTAEMIKRRDLGLTADPTLHLRRVIDANGREQNVLLRDKEAQALQTQGFEIAPATTKQITVTNVSDKYKKELATAVAKTEAEAFGVIEEGASTALKSLGRVKDSFAILDSGIVAGAGAEWITGAGRALMQLGLIPETSDAATLISNTRTYVASRATEVANLIKAFGAGTGLSDADREFAEQAAAASATMTEQTMRDIMILNAKASFNLIEQRNQKLFEISEKTNGDIPYSPIGVPRELLSYVNMQPSYQGLAPAGQQAAPVTPGNVIDFNDLQ